MDVQRVAEICTSKFGLYDDPRRTSRTLTSASALALQCLLENALAAATAPCCRIDGLEARRTPIVALCSQRSNSRQATACLPIRARVACRVPARAERRRPRRFDARAARCHKVVDGVAAQSDATRRGDDDQRQMVPRRAPPNCPAGGGAESNIARHADGDAAARAAGLVVHPLIHLANHSCAPSCGLVYTPDVRRGGRATRSAAHAAPRAIPRGEEVTYSYLGVGPPPPAARRELLLRRWGFRCGCRLCSGVARQLGY